MIKKCFSNLAKYYLYCNFYVDCISFSDIYHSFLSFFASTYLPHKYNRRWQSNCKTCNGGGGGKICQISIYQFRNIWGLCLMKLSSEMLQNFPNLNSHLLYYVKNLRQIDINFFIKWNVCKFKCISNTMFSSTNI